LVLIEEIDAAAGDRRGRLGLDGGVEKRVVATLLNCLDGIHKLHQNVLVLFTTNLPRLGVDAAFKRRVELLEVPKLGLEELMRLLARRIEAEPMILGGEPWNRIEPLVRQALETEIGRVFCGKDPVPVAAHCCLSGATAAAAFERCAERVTWRKALGLEQPGTPDELARELVRGAAAAGSNMSLSEAREFFTGAELIDPGKAREIVNLPTITWRDGASTDEDIRALAEQLIRQWSPSQQDPAGVSS